jgi:hypothetical protein
MIKSSGSDGSSSGGSGSGGADGGNMSWKLKDKLQISDSSDNEVE